MHHTPLRLSVVALLVATPALAAWRSEGPFAGNVTDLAFAPKNPAVVYAAVSGAGVWRSEDAGKTWTLPGGELTNRSIEWVKVDPNDDTRIWAGVKATGSGAGLWRSSDRGATWKAVQDGYKGSGRMHTIGQPIAFVGPKTIFVAATNQHYRSDDGGKTWTSFDVPSQDAYVFAVDPKNPKHVLAGGRGMTQHISRSTDGGKTWKMIGQGLGTLSVYDLFFDAADSKVVYATGGTFTTVFRSSDGGETWSEIKLPVGGTSDLFDFKQSPNDPKSFWAATEDGLLVSEDGGESWTESGEGIDRYLATAIAFDPANPKRMLVGTGGTGVYASADGGNNFAPSSQGLAAGWVERIWGAPKTDTLMVQLSVGLFDREADGNWLELEKPFADGKSAKLDGVAFDRKSPDTVYAFDASRLWKSDGGRFKEIEKPEPSMRDMMKGNLASVQFASFVVDPGNPKTFYAGSWSNDEPETSVFKSVDGGKKWKPSGKGLPSDRIDMLRSEAPGKLLAVVEKKQVFRSLDGAANWNSAGAGLPGAEIHELAIDPTNPDRAYVATEKGLFRTPDGGTAWTRLTNGIKGDEVEGLVVDPSSGAVYVGTFHGVFRSTDGGASFTSVTGDLKNTDVRALAIGGKTPRLWVGLAGGSVMSMELPATPAATP